MANIHKICLSVLLLAIIDISAAGIFSSLFGGSSSSRSQSQNQNAAVSDGSGNTPTEQVTDSSTEPRGDDFAKMVAGAVESMLAYEHARQNSASDTRPTSVFYEGLGTFYRNGSLSNLNKLPMTPEQIGTKFMLYTQQNQAVPDIIDYKDPSSIQKSRFQPGKPTVVITHGFKTSSGQAGLQWVMLFVDALFRRQGPGNYIVTDWSNGAQAPDYWAAAANTQLVGAQLAKLIQLISQVKQVPISSFVLMGFSLGSHVSGFAGKRLGNAGKPQRIFGIDPAGPLFEKADPGGRLSKGDAAFVVAEHGSADGLKNGGLGIWQQLGDIDFYANGGREQPGCGNMVSTAINKLITFNFKAVPEAVRCNHDRNWMYILQTFDPQCYFPATACDVFGNVRQGQCSTQQRDTNQVMGFFMNNQPSSAPLFFDTEDGAIKQTSCQYHVKVNIKSMKQSLSTRGNFQISFIDNNGVETTPFVIAQDGRVPAGKQAFLLVRSAVLPSTITKMKITFQHQCDPTTCNAEVINLQSVTVATIKNDIILNYCGGGDLISQQTRTLDLVRSKACKSSGFVGAIINTFVDALLS